MKENGTERLAEGHVPKDFQTLLRAKKLNNAVAAHFRTKTFQ